MAAPTVAAIKAILDVVNYPENTITSDLIYDFVQARKRYPSIEIEMSKPESFRETKERTENSYTFRITFLYKQLGLGSDEMADVRTIEGLIIAALQGATLGDHKITNQFYEWSRSVPDAKHPYFIHSVLNISVSRIQETNLTPDGTLKYVASGSVVDNAATDETYLNVYDVNMSEGYADHEEMVTGSLVPIHYPGRFNGTFIAHVHVDKANIGSEGSKLNKLMAINSSGYKPEFKFSYTNFDTNNPPSTLSEAVTVEIDKLDRLYSHVDFVRYRIMGKLVQPSTIS